MLCLILIASSNTSTYAEDVVSSGKTADKIDAVLLLDVSGSMLVTDPLRLRQDGAKLFAQFLKKEDRLAIVAFDESASVIKPLEPYDPAKQDVVGDLIASAEAKGAYTNILAGLSKASSILQNNSRPDAQQVIILMSDGKMEPSPDSGTTEGLTTQLIESFLPDLKKNGTKVYTLAFSELADKSLLKDIAAITDSISWFTPTADKIHESFADLFLAVKKPQVVPLTKKGFKLDPDVQEATFYINREGSTGDITVTRPDGFIMKPESPGDNAKWFRGQKFDVLTITAPIAGDWQLSGVTAQDGFATVLTKLRLVSEWPSNQYAQSEILLEARLFEEDKPISLPEMSGTIQFAFQITPTDKVSEPIIRDFLNDEGKDGDRVAHDGIFSKMVAINESGEYKLRVLSKAPTFERNQQIPFRVKPPLVQVKVTQLSEQEFHSAEVLANEEEATAEHGDPQEQSALDVSKGRGHSDENKETPEREGFETILNEDVLGFKKFSVRLFASDSNKTRYEIPLTKDKNSKARFIAPSSLLPREGKYTLQGILTGETKRGQDSRAESRILDYQFVPTAGHSTEPQVKVVEKKKEPIKQRPASPTIPIILMTLLNGAAIFQLFKYFSKQKVEQDDSVPDFPSIDKAIAVLKKLQEKLALETIDLTIPFLANPEITLPPLWVDAASGSNNQTVDDSHEESSVNTEESVSAEPQKNSVVDEPNAEAPAEEEPKQEYSEEEQ